MNSIASLSICRTALLAYGGKEDLRILTDLPELHALRPGHKNRTMARPQFLAPGEDGPQPVFLLVPAVNFFGELGPRVCHQIGIR